MNINQLMMLTFFSYIITIKCLKKLKIERYNNFLNTFNNHIFSRHDRDIKLLFFTFSLQNPNIYVLILI